jgi:hypothetical protein
VVLWIPGWVVSNIDDAGSPYAPFFELASRDIRLVHLLSLDERVADLRAAVEAVGDERPSLIGTGEGGPVSIL